MKISESNAYLSEWKYVEIARYVPSLHKVVRQKSGDKPVMINVNSIDDFRKSNGNTGLYTSVWWYNSTDIENAIRLGPLYFDIDNEDLDVSILETQKLYSYLLKYIPEDSILVFFTGKKGFHIECEPIALGINPSNNLYNIFRFIATTLKEKLHLTSIDFSVYDQRRMWRLQGSAHQETGLFKTLISKDILFSDKNHILDYSRVEHEISIKDQTFNATANEWFRNFTYELEIEKERSKDFIAYFNKHGSGVFKDLEEKNKVFTKDRLLEHCPAILKLIDEAKSKKWLDHEARLFLCSILTYTEDSIQFLHEILSNCDDYNFEKSSSHINDWIKRRQLGIGGRPYTCERANVAGVGCGQCELDKKKKWIKIGNKYVESEEVSAPSPIRFAFANENKGGEYA